MLEQHYFYFKPSLSKLSLKLISCQYQNKIQNVYSIFKRYRKQHDAIQIYTMFEGFFQGKVVAIEIMGFPWQRP